MNRIHIKIGRAKNNQVVVDDPTVADVHLELFSDERGNVFITDLESIQGTYVNGKRLKGYTLLDEQDVVILGNSYKFNWKKYKAQAEDAKAERPRPVTPVQSANKTIAPKRPPTESSVQNSPIANLSKINKELLIIYGLVALILLFIVFLN